MSYTKERYNPTAGPQGADGLIAWCVKQFQAIARAMPWAPHADTRDFVTVGEGADASAQFTAAANAVGTGTLFGAPRTYRFSSNVTIPAATLWKPANGCLLRPDSGVTVTINGPVEAGAWQWLDPSGGGMFVFTTLRQFRGEWFGPPTDGITNATPAFNFMSRTVSDYADVVFRDTVTYSLQAEWLTNARRGVRYLSETHPFPDGGGASLVWHGPPPQVGRNNNATVTNGSQIITFAHPLSRAPQVGERFIARGVGTPNLNAAVVADAGNSTTQIKVDTAASFTGGPYVGTAWTLGGTMVTFLSCDHCEISGFAIQPTQIAGSKSGMGLAGYIAAGSAVLNNASTLGSSKFTGKAGQMIRVVGAGPGGSDLITTIAASPAPNDTQCTLNATASTTITSTALTQYVIGQDGTTLPALWAIITDLSGTNGATGTNCFVNKNLIDTVVNFDFTAIGISLTTSNNQELHEVIRNTIQVGGPGQIKVAFFAHCTTTAGSTTIATDVSNTVTSDMIGWRIRVPGVGQANFTGASINGNDLTTFPNSVFETLMVGQSVTVHGAGVAGADLVTTIAKFVGPAEVILTTPASVSLSGTASGFACGALLDTKINGVIDNQHFTVLDAPSVSASGKVPSIGNCYNNCIEIGASFNAKREVIEHNIFSNFQYGVWLRNGSFASFENQFEVGEMMFVIDANTTPCLSVGDDHEAVLRVMGVSNVILGGVLPVTFEGTRCGSENMICHGGHFMSGQQSGPIRLTGLGFDNMPDNVESRFIESHGGSWTVEDCTFPSAVHGVSQLTTLSQVFDPLYLIATSGQIWGRNWRNVSDAPMQFYYGGDQPTAIYALVRHSAGEAHIIDLQLINLDDTLLPTSTIRAKIDTAGGGPAQEIIGVDAQMCTDVISSGNAMDSSSPTGVRIQLPTGGGSLWRNTVAGKAVRGLHIASPANPSPGNVTNPVYGVHIEQVGISGISDPRGVWQEGVTDPNLFAGPTAFGTSTNARITNIQVYSPTLTPASVAAQTVAEQTFTVTGLTTADKVMVNPPAIANATGIAGARVSALNTLAIRFTNPTAGALTPSSGTYTVIAIRS